MSALAAPTAVDIAHTQGYDAYTCSSLGYVHGTSSAVIAAVDARGLDDEGGTPKKAAAPCATDSRMLDKCNAFS